MPRVLLATDADWIHQEVDAALGGDDIEVVRVNQGVEVRPAVQTGTIDLVVLDLQIGNMGGMAACMEIRLDESVDLIDHVPVLMLLDRDVDAFLAKRSEADGWVVKPVDAFTLRRAATALLAGDEWKPVPTDGILDDDIEDEIDEAEVTDEAEVNDETVDHEVDGSDAAEAPSTEEVTAEGDQGADPANTPGAEVSAEKASETQGP